MGLAPRAIELSKGNIVLYNYVSDIASSSKTVCLMNASWNQTKCPQGKAADIGNSPFMAADKYDNILLRSAVTGRITVLDSNLEYVGEIFLPINCSRTSLYRLHIDECNERLFVSDYLTPGRLFVITSADDDDAV